MQNASPFLFSVRFQTHSVRRHIILSLRLKPE